MREKYFTIDGLPRFVEISKYENSAWAYVRVDHPFVFTLSELADVLKKLSELGFEYESLTHDLGYYDSVENRTIECRHNNAKSLPLISLI